MPLSGEPSHRLGWILGRRAALVVLGAALSGPLGHGSFVRTAAAQSARNGHARSPARPHILWRFGAGAPIAGEPAVAPDGRLFLATSEGCLHALGPEGQFLWSYTLSGSVVGSPAVGENGTIYVGTTAGRVYAVDPVGTLRWEFRLPFAVVSSVVVGAFGSLYFTESEQHLYAVSAAAVPIWRKDIGDSVSAGPLVSDGGRIVVGTRSGELLSFGWSGQARKIPLSLALDRKLWQAEDGSLYGLAEQALIALDRSGNERWGFGPARAAAVGSGNIAVIGLHSDVTWLDSEGVPFSRFGLKTELGPQVAVVAGRAYLVASLHNEIWAVKPTGSVEARLFIDSGPIGSVLGDPRFGRILVVSGGSTLTGVSTLP